MAEKITIMVLKVDLECTKCYKKVKKLLCKYPQIRDQTYDEKANTVTIMVVCCSPEKLRDKLCHKGRGTIKSIDIKQPEKPEKTKLKPVENPPQKPKEDPAKNVTFVVPPKVETPKPTHVNAPESAPKPPETTPKPPESAPKPPETAPKPPEPVLIPVPVPITAYPPPYYMPPGGPCYGGHGDMLMPVGPPPPCNCGCGGRRDCYYGYGGGGRGYTICRCDYFSEENPSACRVM